MPVKETFLNEISRDIPHQNRGKLRLFIENITIDGKLSDSFEGHQITTGHSLEACLGWFGKPQRIHVVTLQRPSISRAADEKAIFTSRTGSTNAEKYA